MAKEKKVAEATDSKKTAAKEEKPKGPKMLGSKEVADILGIKPAALRRYLRSKGRKTTDEQTRYQWAEGSKEIAALKKEYEAYLAEQKKAAAERGKKLAEGAKKGEKKGKKKGKPAEEDTEDTEEEEEEI